MKDNRKVSILLLVAGIAMVALWVFSYKSQNISGNLKALFYVGGFVLAGVGAALLVKAMPSMTKNLRQVEEENAEPSIYAVRVMLYDNGYDEGLVTTAAMLFTFTDADTGRILGRGTQNQTLILNVDKPTRIRCHLGRGFKDLVWEYTPREGAIYRIIPNSYTGLRIEIADNTTKVQG